MKNLSRITIQRVRYLKSPFMKRDWSPLYLHLKHSPNDTFFSNSEDFQLKCKLWNKCQHKMQQNEWNQWKKMKCNAEIWLQYHNQMIIFHWCYYQNTNLKRHWVSYTQMCLCDTNHIFQGEMAQFFEFLSIWSCFGNFFIIDEIKWKWECFLYIHIIPNA